MATIISAARRQRDQRSFLLQRAQPAMVGLIDGSLSTLAPIFAVAFATYPKATEALAWMGFEARTAILKVLDQAIADTAAQVRVIAYDLNEPVVVSRLERLPTRLTGQPVQWVVSRGTIP